MSTEAVVTSARDRRDFGSLRLRGKFWYIRYRVDGREHWENARTKSRREAEKLLARRQAELGLGLLTEPDARRVSFNDLAELIRTDYRVKGHRSIATLEQSIGRLADSFGASRALAITTDRVTAYEAARLAEGLARATVNKDLAALRRMFTLALRARRLPANARPMISTPNPKNARTGFFEPDDFELVASKLPETLRGVFRFAYLTGWRTPSEVLPLTWSQVDFRAGIVRLEPNTTKNDEGRVFPFAVLPSLATLLDQQRAYTEAIQRQAGRIIPHVFHREGRAIRSYADAWQAAREKAARDERGAIVRPHLLARVSHDFRRTAVRNLVRAGVPERVAMQLTGHKTRAIFDRYDIVNEADLRAGVQKLAAFFGGQKGDKVATRDGRAG